MTKGNAIADAHRMANCNRRITYVVKLEKGKYQACTHVGGLHRSNIVMRVKPCASRRW